MPKPEGFNRRVFKARNGFSPYARWDTTGEGVIGVVVDPEKTPGCASA
jgi:hypothetical protein